MIWRYLLFTAGLLIFFSAHSFSQQEWTLKQDHEGIKVYTKDMGNSPFKAIKTVCTIDASLTRLTAVLLDINSSADWVYATKSCRVLEQSSPAELVYYSEVEVPWPAANRDFIVSLKVFQDKKNKAVTVIGENRKDYLPENKNIVRIPQSYSKWYIQPISKGQVQIEYTLQVDPGGMIPAWLINLFAAKGPFESFKKLRQQVKKDMYNDVKIPFITD
jgi:hypothetical protein